MIIGICGLIGAGKDTIADYLVNIYGFKRESFAGTLKDAVAAVFGWDRELLEGRTTHSRAWREQVDPWWAERLGIPGLTPRWVLQHWGTEVVRRAFHDDTWIAALENRLRNQQDHVVISDCRFPNEIAAIKRAGGIVVRVTRGPEPSWYYLAEMSNRGLTVFQDELKSVGIHASETAWIGTDFDAILDNNAGMDHLYAQVNNLVQDPQLATADLNAVPLQHSSNI
jgi:hypothetical protein